MMDYAPNPNRNFVKPLKTEDKVILRRCQTAENGAQRILFLKNEPGKLLKTKDEPKKRSGNEAETNRAMLLKTQDRH